MIYLDFLLGRWGDAQSVRIEDRSTALLQPILRAVRSGAPRLSF
jgi:hypothetical protein